MSTGSKRPSNGSCEEPQTKRRELTHKRKVGVALIGYGRIGLVHAKSLSDHPLVELLYIVGRNTDTLEQVVSRFDNVKAVTDLAEALSDPSVEGVVVASPTSFHVDHILQCIAAKKAVFCEKPISLEPEGVRKCFEAARKANVPLLCGYQRRFDSSLQTLQQLISGTAMTCVPPSPLAGLPNATQGIGKPTLLRLSSRDHPPPPASYLSASSTGSFFDDFSTHDVDLARWLTSEEPSHVYATASNFLGGKGDDTAVIVLKFPSGALCVIDNSRQTSYGYDVRVEVLGDSGLGTVENPKNTSLCLSDRQNYLTEDVCKYSFPERFVQAYQSEIAYWIGMITDALPCCISEEDCVNNCTITSLAQQSREKQKESNKKIPRRRWDYETYPRISDAQIGVAVFGTGRMGRVRGAAFARQRDTTVLYGVDLFEASSDSFAKELNCKGLVLSEENLITVLSDPKVNVVMITTTSSSHKDLIIRSLQAGKHVFCEKPLALTAEDTEVCVQLAREKNLGLYCGFQRRSDRHFRQLKSVITGKKQLIRVTSREPGGHSDITYLLSSGGFLFDSCIHDIDMANFLADENDTLVEVFCQGHAFNPKLREAGDVDAIVIILRFQSGLIVSIDNHRNAVYGYDQRAEVHTSTGMFSVQNVPTSTVVVATENGHQKCNPLPGMERYAEAYEEDIVHFVRLLRGEDSIPRSHPEDCVWGARVAEAASRSMKTGLPQTI